MLPRPILHCEVANVCIVNRNSCENVFRHLLSFFHGVVHGCDYLAWFYCLHTSVSHYYVSHVSFAHDYFRHFHVSHPFAFEAGRKFMFDFTP